MTDEARILGELLLKHKLIVASAESCTGGRAVTSRTALLRTASSLCLMFIEIPL